MKRSRKNNTASPHSATPPVPVPATSDDIASPQLLDDLRSLIAQARERTAQAVNTELVLLHWHIGSRIRQDLLGEERADYGQQVISGLAHQLTAEYGKGFGAKNLLHMIRFAEVFPDLEIVSSLIRQLTWTHFLQLIYLKDPLEREFYAEMCRLERWSVRTLRSRIDSLLYQRTALSHKTEDLIRHELEALRKEDQMTPDLVFRDPYLLDFLGLTGAYSERDLENAILRELEGFLLELGTDFTFVARQKRMTIGDEDLYLDLLFYHRGLRRLVAIELKLERFQAAHKGQMELYLRWLDRYERRPGEESPVGLILCSQKNQEQIELLQLDQSDIRVAQYLTEQLPRPLLEQKLHEAIRLARQQIAARQEPGTDPEASLDQGAQETP